MPTNQSIFSTWELKIKKQFDSDWSLSFPRLVIMGAENAKKPKKPHTENGACTLKHEHKQQASISKQNL